MIYHRPEMDRSWRVPERKRRGRTERRERRKREEEKPKNNEAPSKREKKHFRQGTVAMCEIKNFQRSVGFLIHKLPFAWWVWEIAQEHCTDLHFQTTSLLTLLEVVETYAVSLSKDANLCVVHTSKLL